MSSECNTYRQRLLSSGAYCQAMTRIHDDTAISPFKHPVLENRKIVDLCCGTNFSLICLDDYTVWGFGSNSRHQLSTSAEESSTNLVKVAGLDGIRVIKVRAKGEHSVFVTDDGRVFTCGANDWNNCGYTDGSGYPKQVIFPKNTFITDAQSGYGHTLCLDGITGKAYSFGGKSFKQLGRKDHDSIVGEVQTPAHVRVAKIISGAAHSIFICEVILTGEEEVYVCGKNNCGSLANNTFDHTQGPELLDLTQFHPHIKRNFLQIDAGQNHTAFLTDMYQLFIAGDNDSGQIDVTANTMKFSRVQHINPLLPKVRRNITHLCCAYNATMIITEGADQIWILGNKNFSGCQENRVGMSSLFELNNKYLRYDPSKQKLRATAGEGPVLILIEEGDNFTRCFPKYKEATGHADLYDVTIVTQQ